MINNIDESFSRRNDGFVGIKNTQIRLYIMQL